MQPAGDLAGTPVTAAQRAFHMALKIHRRVLAGEVQVAVPATLHAVEAGVLADFQVGIGPANIRVTR
jgi:hypothetical protein